MQEEYTGNTVEPLWASVSRLKKFLLVKSYLVYMGFQNFFLFWVAGIILKGWGAELETDPVIGN